MVGSLGSLPEQVYMVFHVHFASQGSDIVHDRNQAYNAAAKSLQSCPTLCDPIDGSPPGSPIPGILQARVLEWGASTPYMLIKS